MDETAEMWGPDPQVKSVKGMGRGAPQMTCNCIAIT